MRWLMAVTLLVGLMGYGYGCSKKKKKRNRQRTNPSQEARQKSAEKPTTIRPEVRLVISSSYPEIEVLNLPALSLDGKHVAYVLDLGGAASMMYLFIDAVSTANDASPQKMHKVLIYSESDDDDSTIAGVQKANALLAEKQWRPLQPVVLVRHPNDSPLQESCPWIGEDDAMEYDEEKDTDPVENTRTSSKQRVCSQDGCLEYDALTGTYRGKKVVVAPNKKRVELRLNDATLATRIPMVVESAEKGTDYNDCDDNGKCARVPCYLEAYSCPKLYANSELNVLWVTASYRSDIILNHGDPCEYHDHFEHGLVSMPE